MSEKIDINTFAQQSYLSIKSIFRPFENYATIATHAGHVPNNTPDVGRPIAPPICMSSTFQQPEPGVFKYEYSRANNYSRESLEKCIGELEGNADCCTFASGIAALGALLQLFQAGDHLIMFDDLYGGSSRLLRHTAKKTGMEVTPIDLRNTDLLKNAITPKTKLVLLETPSNPLMRLVDIEAVVKVCRQYKDILVVVDNTFLSSFFQRPLDLGADVVLYSLTKYMNGHSDVIMGALVSRNEKIMEELRFIQMAVGAVPSPFDCFMCLRGIRTLPTRMRTHQKNAFMVAHFLEAHPKVENVIHPGLKSHPQHELACRQMHGCSGMISVYLKCGKEQAVSFVSSLKLFYLAESLGGYESLIEIPSIMTHASVPAEVREKNRITDNLIRLSVGIEDAQDLIDDLAEALNKI